MLVRSKVSPETNPEIVLFGIAEPPICNCPPASPNVMPPLTTAPTSRSSTPDPPIEANAAAPLDATVSNPPLLIVSKLALPPDDTVREPPLLIVSNCAVPPDDTVSLPPLLIVPD